MNTLQKRRSESFHQELKTNTITTCLFNWKQYVVVFTFHQDFFFRNSLEQFVVLRVVLADSLWKGRGTQSKTITDSATINNHVS